MKEEELKQEVNRIIGMSGDDEAAHGAEDRLHLKIIEAFCPDWVKEEVNRLTNTNFERWCA